MTKLHHINAAERDQIGVLLASGISQREIARKLHRSFSSINYEIHHNSRGGTYRPIQANYLSRERNRLSQKQHARKDPGIWYYVIDKLRCSWSPEQIAGRLKKHNHGKSVISYETIYRHIYQPENSKDNLNEYLPRAHRKRYPKHARKSYRRGIPHRVSISLRSKRINNRSQFGHWEADVVEGKRSGPGIQTLLERKTRYYQTGILKNVDSEYGIKVQKRMLSKFPQKARRSVTFDNGRENYNHEQLKRDLGVKTFFCDPYAAWQKGANENHNGILRRYLPKKTDLSNLHNWELEVITEEINNKPRKCLNYQTPKETFKQELKRSVII
jgi:IS30 family transposase